MKTWASVSSIKLVNNSKHTDQAKEQKCKVATSKQCMSLLEGTTLMVHEMRTKDLA